MRSSAAALLILLGCCSQAVADNAFVVTSCGSMSYSPGGVNSVTQDQTGTLCTYGSGGGTGGGGGTQNVSIVSAPGLQAPGPQPMSGAQAVTMATDQTPIKAGTTGNVVPANILGVLLKGSPGYVTSIQLGGVGAAPVWLKLYNKATAPTCGTDTPVKRLIIPAAATAANGAGSNIPFPAGIYFSAGIGYCVTTGLPDTDTGVPAANTYAVNVDWQ